MRRALALCCLLATLAGCGEAAPRAAAAATQSPESEIAAASRAFSDAYVRGDTAAIGDLYTDDGVALPPGRELRGRAAITRYFAPGPNRHNVAHAMTSAELTVTGSVATDYGMWSNTFRAGDGEPQTASGRYLVVWVRGDDGRWRMRYDMWHRPE